MVDRISWAAEFLAPSQDTATRAITRARGLALNLIEHLENGVPDGDGYANARAKFYDDKLKFDMITLEAARTGTVNEWISSGHMSTATARAFLESGECVRQIFGVPTPLDTSVRPIVEALERFLNATESNRVAKSRELPDFELDNIALKPTQHDGPDPEANYFWWKGKPYPLTTQEHKFALALWNKGHRSFSEIGWEVWGDECKNPSTIKSLASRLSNKLAEIDGRLSVVTHHETGFLTVAD